VQRSKEEAHDYRYFPEPDIPPLVVEEEWVEEIKRGLPELPRAMALRLREAYALTPTAAAMIANESDVARYFEACVAELRKAAPRAAANWITGELFAYLNQSGIPFKELRVSPRGLAELLDALEVGEVNQNTAKMVLTEMLVSGASAARVIREKNLTQVTDSDLISSLVSEVIAAHPAELASYLAGKETLANWFFGQVMRAAGGKASPAVLKLELERQLNRVKDAEGSSGNN